MAAHAVEAWDPAKHPRGPDGRFIRKAAVSALLELASGQPPLPFSQLVNRGRAAASRRRSTGRPRAARPPATPDVAPRRLQVADLDAELDRLVDQLDVDESRRQRLRQRLRAAVAEETRPPDVEVSQLPTPAPPAPGEHEVEERLRAAYRMLAPQAGDLVSLADLRDSVGDLDPAEFEAALRRLNRQRGVTLVPEANQKTLDARARSAAVVIGDQSKHAIAMGAVEAAAEAATPAGQRLKRYWTKDPEGLAKWAGRPHPWTALYRQLVRHMPPARAKRVASAWFKEVFGIWPGERFGDNPTGPG